MPDLSLISIPTYYMLVCLPHLYAVSRVALSKNPKAYNNANAGNDNGAIEKALGPAGFPRYQRAKAAHANGHEAFPLFVAAVLASRFAGLESDAFALTQLGLRALYNVLYISIADVKTSYARTAVWDVKIVWCMWQIVRAAMAVK